MPDINDYHCDQCRFRMPSGWGSYMYVSTKRGRRIRCRHPDEGETVRHVLGENAPRALIQARTGVNSDAVCMDCLAKFMIDLERDARICRKCKSTNVKTVEELVDKPCPKCKKGKIREYFTGTMC